jgi:hypothetical protein
MEDLRRFIEQLSDRDLDLVTAELERIVFGDDTAALESAKTKVISGSRHTA